MKRNIKKSMLFIGMTFSFSWLLVILFAVFGGKWYTISAFVIAIIYMFAPMTMAIIIQKFIYKERTKEPFGISFKLNPWFLVAWLLPPVIAFGAFGVSLLFPGVVFSSDMTGMFERFRFILTPEQLEQIKIQINASSIHPIWFTLIQSLIAGITINAIAGFGEELGWRGFLHKEFEDMWFWKSSLLIGFIWGLWHAPIIFMGHNYPQHPVAGIFMMIIFCLLLGPIISYVRIKAKSVIAAAVFHGSLNATFVLAIMLVKGGNDLIVGVTGLAGIVVLILIDFGLFVYDQVFAKESI